MISRQLELEINKITPDYKVIIDWLNNIDKPNSKVLVFLGMDKSIRTWLVKLIEQEINIKIVYPGLEKYIDHRDRKTIYICICELYGWNKLTKPPNLIICAKSMLINNENNNMINSDDIIYVNLT